MISILTLFLIVVIICHNRTAEMSCDTLYFVQLRAYLQNNKDTLLMDRLILYCYQLSMAVSYLESKKYVHR